MHSTSARIYVSVALYPYAHVWARPAGIGQAGQGEGGQVGGGWGWVGRASARALSIVYIRTDSSRSHLQGALLTNLIDWKYGEHSDWWQPWGTLWRCAADVVAVSLLQD